MKRISRPLVMFVILYQQVCHVSMIFSPPLSCWCRLHCWYYAPPLTLQQGPECSFMNESLGQADGDPDESRRFQENPQNSRSITGEPRRIMTNLGYVETIRKMLKLHPPIWCWNLFCFGLSLGDGMWFKWLSSPSDHLSKQQLLAGNLAISDPRFQGWVLQVEGIQKRLLCSREDHPCYCGDSDLIM